MYFKRIQLIASAVAIASLAVFQAQGQDADGLGVNVPLVGRLMGGGGTLFITAVDVTNHRTVPARVDFYLTVRRSMAV